MTMGKIADIYESRGQLEEALRIRRRRKFPSTKTRRHPFPRGDDGKIADIYESRGQLDEALRIRRRRHSCLR